ncbi:hypothetical protein FOXB_16035 [Fusarium oxysporum f. sp. conglutinans Fo5176]|uniref:Uncharacterized protein n=1 Tax=Fusarium oxysporum (strain Fo5176) TaxID=660025 RepID=F9GBK2_FUSOF|nr:hypothetical protein FOXB_16035 [Fusarium oxysporum f. sp. conglutinans Fo5176]
MWPPEFREHQSDDHNVEQNETTPWLQHTGWPRLFHEKPLGIIAATARKPNLAWNEDYLLGQWNDIALHCPAAVEAQLRIILRGVDLMVDRATFTLAKTSYRSRCWLNTYWKDTFWPHEFRIVNCLTRYIDIWKRFICYVIRVQHFKTHYQQEIYNIYNLRLGHDETIMIHHILYLVSLLQGEAANYDENLNDGSEQDEDEHSDYDDEDENEDDHGPGEEYINECGQVETETHCNENDEYCDANSGEDVSSVDPTFSLPSGLWLHLSEAIFQLSMMFWTYQDPTGDMSASTIIHYTAVLGIQGPSLTFHPAHGSTPKLAALMWIGRLLFLEYAVPVYAYNTLDLAWPCRTAYPSQPDRISSIRCKYLLRGCYIPFGELIELKAFAKSIVKREGVPGNLTWAPDGRSFTIGDDKKVLLSEFCETHHKAVATVQEQVDEMLLGWQPDIDVSTIRDDLTLQKSSFRGTPFTNSGHWNMETCHKYLDAGVELNKSAFAAVHFKASLPGRGTEVTSIRHLNSRLSIRNVFFYDGRMIIIISYNKARASNNYAFYIVRYIPVDLSLSLLKYLAVVRPVSEFLSKKMHTARHESREFFFLDPNGKRKHLSSGQASGILRSRTRDLITPWTLSLYRQAALAIAKRYLTKLVEKTNFYYPSSAADPMRMFAAGAGHHPRMLLTTYAIDRALPERLQPELLEMYRRLSNIWQDWSRQYYHEYCLRSNEESSGMNAAIAHKVCAKRVAEPCDPSRSSKIARTSNAASCHDTVQTEYADGFLYNAQYQVLVCIACKSMIQPGQKSFYSHLNKLHRITGLACKALMEQFSTYKLCSFQELAVPRQKSLYEGLTMYGGYICTCAEVQCDYCTRRARKMHGHMPVHGRKASEHTNAVPLWRACKLQTYFTAKGLIDYFLVEEDLSLPLTGEALAGSGLAMASTSQEEGKLFEDLKADIIQRGFREEVHEAEEGERLMRRLWFSLQVSVTATPKLKSCDTSKTDNTVPRIVVYRSIETDKEEVGWNVEESDTMDETEDEITVQLQGDNSDEDGMVEAWSWGRVEHLGGKEVT